MFTQIIMDDETFPLYMVANVVKKKGSNIPIFLLVVFVVVVVASEEQELEPMLMMIIPTLVVAHHMDDIFFFLVGEWYLVQVKEAFMAFSSGWWWFCGSVIGDSVIGDLDNRESWQPTFGKQILANSDGYRLGVTPVDGI
jgi:hypothetical protein